MTQNGSIPNDAIGNHPLVETVNRLNESARERTIIAGPGIIITRTMLGVKISLAQNKGAGGSGEDGQARWA